MMKRWLLVGLLWMIWAQSGAQAADEPTAQLLERDGTALHYWLYGAEDAPLIVLTHGAGLDHRMFAAQIEPLVAANYRVLVWDVRGHGLSKPLGDEFTMPMAAEDLIAIVDAVGVERFILIGQSMGGYISQYVYLAYPERVIALGMIGSMSVTASYAKADIQALAASLTILENFPYPALINLTATQIALQPDVQDYVRAALGQLTHEEFNIIWAGVTGAITEAGVPERLLEVPLLITHGDADNTGLIRAKAPAWAKTEPDSTYVVIPDAAHNANQDNPTFFNETLLAWLTTFRVEE